MEFITNRKIVQSISHQQKGFALLFSVLISSLLLTIGLSIFNIALKELAISTATERSVHAFYAADSGRECAMYWNNIRGQIPGVFDQLTNEGVVSCGSFVGKTITGSGISMVSNEENTTNIGEQTDPIFIKSSDSDGPNFYVLIEKTIDNRGIFDQVNPKDNQFTQTIITSTGRDSTGGDRIERAMEIKY